MTPSEKENGQDPKLSAYEQMCHTELYKIVKKELCTPYMALCLAKLAKALRHNDIDEEELQCSVAVISAVLQIRAEIELEND